MFSCINCGSRFSNPEIVDDSIPMYYPDGTWSHDKDVTIECCPACGAGEWEDCDDDEPRDDEADVRYEREGER
jgi:hypothetical protein